MYFYILSISLHENAEGSTKNLFKREQVMKKIGDKKALYFSNRLRQKVSGLRRVILFGSRARGDAQEGSYYDFAVILDKKNAKTIKAVRGAEVDFLDKYDTLSSSIIFNISEWEKHKNLPIGLNITRDGVLL
jgi:predicted nucleotidyltransferase